VKAQQGDEAAINSLIEANLRFVVSVAKQYVNNNISLDELVCQGNIGLIHAAKTFDPSKGFKFISYAVWHIRKEILYYFTNHHRSIRVPQNVLTALSQIRLADQSIMQEEGRPGTVEEIYDVLEKTGTSLSIEHIKKYLEAEAKISPLESSDIEDASSPIDWLSSESKANDKVTELDKDHVMSSALSILKPIEKEIVILRLGLISGYPETFSTIGKMSNKSTEWARNIYNRSIKKMKNKLVKKRDFFQFE
jgi:RNA polymerase primary sigma factor